MQYLCPLLNYVFQKRAMSSIYYIYYCISQMKIIQGGVFNWDGIGSGSIGIGFQCSLFTVNIELHCGCVRVALFTQAKGQHKQ